MSDENEELKNVLKDPAMQAQAVDMLVRKRPQGWGRRSVAPYYNERTGMEIRAVLDSMIATKKDKLFDYKEANKRWGLNHSSLYLKIYQGIKYLCEQMDTPDRKYGRFVQTINTTKYRGVGVLLSFKPHCKEDFVSDFTPRDVEIDTNAPLWRIKMMTYLEDTTESKPFIKEGLALDENQIAELKAMLDSIGPTIMHSVTSSSVKIMKVNATE